jgi:hypothetical protein
MAGHEPQPSGLGTHAQQHLRHRQGQQFGVGQLRWPPHAGLPSQVVIDLDVKDTAQT